MAKKLYVGSLSYSTDEHKLRSVFESFGTLLSVAVINDKFTGQSKGFGFVEFEDSEAADTAIAQINGKEIDGRSLVVNEAKPREGGFGGGGRKSFGGDRGGARRY